VICRYPPCGRRGPELPLRGSPSSPRASIASTIFTGCSAVAASTRWLESCFSAVSQPSPPWTEKRRIQSSPSFRAPLGARAWPPRSPQLGHVRHVLFARVRVMGIGNTSPDLGRRWRPFIEGPAAIRVVTVVVLPRFWAKNSAGAIRFPEQLGHGSSWTRQARSSARQTQAAFRASGGCAAPSVRGAAATARLRRAA
jgi:hypothetical protein